MPYKAQETALEIVNSEYNEYTIEKMDNGSLAFVPDNATIGIGLFPGGLVDYESYAPLADALAKNNILCVILDVKSKIPLLEEKIAEDIEKEYSNISTWYIAGHSMGGLAAASYFSKYYKYSNGLILLASYSNIDISNTNKKVLIMYGTNDGVLNKDMYNECLNNLPSNYKEIVIDGGCHSYFADYGVKAEDIPPITKEEQLTITVDAIIDFVTNK